MNRLFYRFFILVMLSISAASLLVYFTISRLFGDPLEEIARRQAAAQVFLLEQYVDKAPSDEWLARLNKVREVSPEAHFDIVPLATARAAVGEGQRDALERGDIVIRPQQRAFYRRVDLKGDKYVGSEGEAILASDLPIDLGFAMRLELVRYGIVALVLLVPIALWSRAHWQSLQQLSRMADQFGGGQLSVRAQMQPSDAIFPLAERINHMADRIESLLEAQRSLLHSVSHEVRTPIARLEFALELLRSAADDPKLEPRIAAMEGDLAELNGLVSELLSMTKLDSQQELAKEAVPLQSTLQGLADSLQPPPPRLDLDLPASLGELQGDRRLLARAIGNLLRNAQKYSNGHVALSARRGAHVEIVVEDDGPGIPEAEREQVFEPFYRLDRSRDRATGGFGLGLSIARKAITLHGGSIAIDASPLGGARFTVVLPLGESQALRS